MEVGASPTLGRNREQYPNIASREHLPPRSLNYSFSEPGGGA